MIYNGEPWTPHLVVFYDMRDEGGLLSIQVLLLYYVYEHYDAFPPFLLRWCKQY